jgi:PAS domain S-box-containing protein
MLRSYAYSGDLWLPLVVTVFAAFLAWYAWRRRQVTAALPFSLGCFFGVMWSLGSLLESAAVDLPTKVVWLRFLTIWQLPLVTATTCFILTYAGFKRFLTRRVLMLLAIPPLLFAPIILTDGLHHLVWRGFSLDGTAVTVSRAPLSLLFLYYSYALFLVNVGVLVWLFVTSPRYRPPVALMLTGQISARLIFELGSRAGFLSRWTFDPFVLGIVFGLYALALFRFHVFDPVPAARAAAIDQMLEGMVVVDPRGQIVDANPVAERMLAIPVAEMRGHKPADLVPAMGDAVEAIARSENRVEAEFELPGGPSARQYRMNVTALRDKRGDEFGTLLLLHDVTEEKRAQITLLEQERVLATLQERERLARELHDGLGQVLGYLSLQTQAARKWLQEGEAEKADAQLVRLSGVAQKAHGEVRESIFALTAASSADWSFLSTLEQYLKECRANYALDAELSVGGGVDEALFSPNCAVQLLRVVQEAVTNAHRHAGACTVRVAVQARGGRARITVSDDGCGFEVRGLRQDRDGHFGLQFMRERMAHIGGKVEIESRPGGGTQVTLDAPALNGEGRSKDESASGGRPRIAPRGPAQPVGGSWH